MLRPLYMPRKVVDAISQHLHTAVDRAVDGFWSANEDEDTLTGHLGACLRTPSQSVTVTREDKEELIGRWRWSVDYTKFRGRGAGATESVIGADGIFELRVIETSPIDRIPDTVRREIMTKTLLFQSKLDWSNDPSIVRQAMLLSTWREAAIVINYTPTAFETFSIDEVVRGRGRKPPLRRDLKEALSKYFLACKIGDTDLFYDAHSRRLAWRDKSGKRIAARFPVPSRIRVNVKWSRELRRIASHEIVPIEDIHNHRMDARAEEMLRPLMTEEPFDLKKQRRNLSLAYHPDIGITLEDRYGDLWNRRQQELNLAYEEVTGQKKGRKGFKS